MVSLRTFKIRTLAEPKGTEAAKMSEKKITLSLTARQLRRLFSKEPEKTIEQIRDQVVSGLWKEFMEKTKAATAKLEAEK